MRKERHDREFEKAEKRRMLQKGNSKDKPFEEENKDNKKEKSMIFRTLKSLFVGSLVSLTKSCYNTSKEYRYVTRKLSHEKEMYKVIKAINFDGPFNLFFNSFRNQTKSQRMRSTKVRKLCEFNRF